MPMKSEDQWIKITKPLRIQTQTRKPTDTQEDEPQTIEAAEREF